VIDMNRGPNIAWRVLTSGSGIRSQSQMYINVALVFIRKNCLNFVEVLNSFLTLTAPKINRDE
jgi:hypothetical protein